MDRRAAVGRLASLPGVRGDRHRRGRSTPSSATAVRAASDVGDVPRSPNGARCCAAVADEMEAGRAAHAGADGAHRLQDHRRGRPGSVRGHRLRPLLRLVHARRSRSGATRGRTFTPHGVVLVASPWNFPYAIPAGGVLRRAGRRQRRGPEAGAGGARGRRSSWLEQLWRAGVPRDLLQFVACPDDEVGRHLVTHDDVDTVVLTGAYETAQLFRSWKPSIRLLAETSGKNALVITAAADEDAAIRDLVRSAFGHAGQKCSAASLAIVEASVYDDPAFMRRLADAVRSVRVGPARRSGHDDRPADRCAVAEAAAGADHAGARGAVAGGAAVPRRRSARLWSPGVRLGVAPGSWFHLTECFGPVLGVMRAESISTTRSSCRTPAEFGLTGGIHSLDEHEVADWLDRVEVGNAYVNRHITGAIVQRQPFGGWKRSSVGCGPKAGGPFYVEAFGTWSLGAAHDPTTRDFRAGVARVLPRRARPVGSGLRAQHAALHRPLPWVDLYVAPEPTGGGRDRAASAALAPEWPRATLVTTRRRSCGRGGCGCVGSLTRRAAGRVARRRGGGRPHATRRRRDGGTAPLGARAGDQPHPSPARSLARLTGLRRRVAVPSHPYGTSHCSHRWRRDRPGGHRRGVEGGARRRRAASTRSTSTSAARATCATARSSATRCSTSCAASTPSCSARSARPRCRPGVIERGLLLKMRFELDLYINQRPFIGTAPGGTDAARLRGHPREHRGPLRGRGRRAAQGHAARGGHAGLGQHPHGRRARHPLRVRAGRSTAPQARHAGAQDQRAHVRRRPVAAGVRRRRRRVPGRGHRLQPRRRGVHLLRAGPAPLRRDRHRQPVRRHPHRPRWRGQRRHRPGVVGQPQPGPHRPEHVRAGARLGARHRRHRQGQPHRRRSCRPR